MTTYFPSSRNFLVSNKHSNGTCLYQSRSKHAMVFIFVISNKNNTISCGIHIIYYINKLKKGLLMIYF
jgi:hypothetical protein